MIIDAIISFLLHVFFPKSKTTSEKREEKQKELTAFFFEQSPLRVEEDSDPINTDYDKGPDW